jgi:hypothetical protein
MSQDVETTLKRSLDAIDGFRRRVYAGGWIVVVGTLGMYARLAYLHRTTDDLERLLGASVAALTFLIAWTAFAIILTTTRTTKRILRAIELLSRTTQQLPPEA